MATVYNILATAVASSTLNDPEVLVIESEIVRVVQAELQELYVQAAQIDPMFFGASLPFASTSSGTYELPSSVLKVGIVRNRDTGREIPVVDVEDLDAEIAPRLYRVGRTLHMPPADMALIGGDAPPLTVYYATAHPDLDPSLPLDAEENTLHESWREEHTELLELAVALHLAERDNREPDVVELSEKVERRRAVFLQHVAGVAGEDVDSRG